MFTDTPYLCQSNHPCPLRDKSVYMSKSYESMVTMLDNNELGGLVSKRNGTKSSSKVNVSNDSFLRP